MPSKLAQAMSPEEEYLQNMSPIDALKFSTQLENKRVYSPAQASDNLRQTGMDLLYASPLGNAMSARDAMEAKWRGQQLEQQGDMEGARRSYAEAAANAGMAFLPGMGRIGLGHAMEDAANSARIFAGPMAKTADHIALAQAQKLAESGVPRDQIWNQTGWFIGADGKWRFEIPDNGARLGDQTTRGLATKFTRLEHPELAAAYSDLPEMRGTYGKSFPTVSGVYQAGSPPYIAAYGPTENAVLPAAIHEFQHHTQRLEDFAPGSNVDQGSWDTYHRTSGEVEARNVQTRMNMTPAERRATPPWLTQDVPDEQQIVRFK